MAKLRKHNRIIGLLIVLIGTVGLLHAQNNYPLHIHSLDADSSYLRQDLGLQTSFDTRAACVIYVNGLLPRLKSKGFASASMEEIRFDSSGASLELFLGQQYSWQRLDMSAVGQTVLDEIGWQNSAFDNKPLDYKQVNFWMDKLVSQLENNGHPFAQVYLDSVSLVNNKLLARVKLVEGPKYKIDSIRVYGDVSINNKFLQRYLEIENGSLYKKNKLLEVGPRLRELSFLDIERPPNLSWLGTGSVLNLYLKPRRSSQINVLIGFLPNSDQLSSKKLLITGDANVELHNALGSGEAIVFNWQQLQVKSPRLHLAYEHPYVFGSRFGLDLGIDMFRKDSTFLNVNMQVGARYYVSGRQWGKLYLLKAQTIVSTVNTAQVVASKELPAAADMSSVSLGIEYQDNQTDYRRNPRRGWEYAVNSSAGLKQIKRNNEILELKDPSDPNYDFARLYDSVKLKTFQWRSVLTAAKYWPIGKQATVKTGLSGGSLLSGSIYRNELFQIGGFRLLRGFDEESQYLSDYAIATIEYRYLFGDSYFYAFSDGGWGRTNSTQVKSSYNYLGLGVGLAFQTKAGLFNIAWAVGRRNDIPFNLRQSKLHFGFVNFF